MLLSLFSKALCGQISRLVLKASGHVCLSASLLLASAITPAAGQGFTPFLSKNQEQKLGAQEHPKLLAEFGGAYADDNAAGYVAQIGGTMVKNSEIPNTGFTFTLLNSKVINAFALPGGYVYISRQLMALMNDEAELASVLGHEVGHVAARHTAKRYNTQIFGSLAGLAVGLLTGSGQLAQLTGQAAQLYTLSYSRSQEFQADGLGVRYMTGAGYDPFAAPDMLKSLGDQTALDARLMGDMADKVPAWARTHPLSSDRVAKATQLATQTGVSAGSRPRNRDRFLAAIDGMLVDDDPEQGFINGQKFEHPKLKITFTAPSGFYLQNSSDAVSMSGPGKAAAQFSGGALRAGASLQSYVDQVWQQLTNGTLGRLGTASLVQINGLDAAVAQTRVNTGQGGVLDVMIAAYRWSPTQAYHIVTLTPAAASGQLGQSLRSMIGSVRRLSDAEAAKLIERRIKVVTVGSKDTLESLAERMAYPDYRLQRFMVLNALNRPQDLRLGEKVKLVVYEKR